MILQQIVAMEQALEMKIFVHWNILVDKMKVIVILMKSVRMLLYVDQIPTVQILLILAQVLIVVGMTVYVHIPSM